MNLKKMCDYESADCFELMKQFVVSCDATNISTDMKNIMTNVPDLAHLTGETEESKQVMHRFENLIVLKMFKRLKWLEKHSYDIRTEINDYNKYKKMYAGNNSISAMVREFNLKSINDHNNDHNNHDSEIMRLMEQILTPHKMTQELLTYELLHYRPIAKVLFDRDDLSSVANQIKMTLNRFNLIIHPYLEDRCSWTVNYKDTLNFVVPKNKIVFSNTIDTQDQENNMIIAHMDMMINYIKRCYKIPSLKYVIVEDNKYYFSWILISMGYYRYLDSPQILTDIIVPPFQSSFQSSSTFTSPTFTFISTSPSSLPSPSSQPLQELTDVVVGSGTLNQPVVPAKNTRKDMVKVISSKRRPHEQHGEKQQQPSTVDLEKRGNDTKKCCNR